MDRLFHDLVKTSGPVNFRLAELPVNIVNVPVDSGVWGILQLVQVLIKMQYACLFSLI